MTASVLGEVVTAGEALGAERTGEALLPCVRPVVAGQLIGACELLVTAWPVTGKGTLTWRAEAGDRETVVSGVGVKRQGDGAFTSDPKATWSFLSPLPLVLEAEFWV